MCLAALWESGMAQGELRKKGGGGGGGGLSVTMAFPSVNVSAPPMPMSALNGLLRKGKNPSPLQTLSLIVIILTTRQHLWGAHGRWKGGIKTLSEQQGRGRLYMDVLREWRLRGPETAERGELRHAAGIGAQRPVTHTVKQCPSSSRDWTGSKYSKAAMMARQRRQSRTALIHSPAPPDRLRVDSRLGRGVVVGIKLRSLAAAPPERLLITAASTGTNGAVPPKRCATEGKAIGTV